MTEGAAARHRFIHRYGKGGFSRPPDARGHPTRHKPNGLPEMQDAADSDRESDPAI
jgi:hypothetical protein